MITLKQITYALAIAKTKHFKKASELCFVSQSALSTAITEMEKQLGFQVFERDNKKVLITSIGTQFLEKALQIKLQMSDIEQLGQSIKEPLSYPMSIGIIPTIGPYLLPKMLPSIYQQYPDFQLSISEEQSHHLVNKVKNGELDAGILALPYDIDGLLTFEFWQEDFYWLTHDQEPLSQQTEISSEQLDISHLMLLKEGHCLKDHALAACKLQASTTNSLLQSTSLQMLVQMVAGRMGTTLIPQMALEQLLFNQSHLKAIHLNEVSPHRKIAFIVRSNYPNINNIELLIRLFRQQLNLN